MSECLKLLYDLSQMAEPLNVNLLRHFFAQYDPSTSRPLRETILHFHMRELESSDYRSAYHQFCDWLYGWNVSDAAEYADVRGSIAEYLRMRRVPREIDVRHDRERAESIRLMKTFETLCSLSRRHLKKFYIDIEAEMPRLGQGLDTLSTNTNKKSRKDDEGSGPGDGPGGTGAEDDDVERVWAVPAKERGLEDVSEEHEDDGDGDNGFMGSDGDGDGDDLFRDNGDEDEGNDSDDVEGGSGRRTSSRGLAVRRRGRNKGQRSGSGVGGMADIADDDEDDDDDDEDDEDFAQYDGATNGDELRVSGAGDGLRKAGFGDPAKREEAGQGDGASRHSSASSGSDREQEMETINSKALTGGNGQQGFNFMQPSAQGTSFQAGTMVEGSGFSLVDNIDDSRRALQRDVNHVFAEVDRCTEYTLVCMSSALVVLTFAEILEDKEVYAKFCKLAHELSMDFVSNTLKTVWDLLNKEIPGEVTLATLRDPYALRDVLKRLLELRAVNSRVPKYRMRKLFYKFATLHDIFRATDIHIFPNFIAAHKEGAKCAKFSAFDSNLWLTGGYDCVIRISDIRSTNNHICLAQYVGHKSIVTDVHFTKNDSQIVSSSFDRTIKIWNAQQATAERTLVGHTDAVTSCDVSSDGRYIASGSTDCTVRFWDYNTGECITIIRKHTRWVKVVRFSPDGRHLATAGLDRRVYIWDTKILANSRSPTHSRCIDSFGDYVLDMAMYRPSMLLTTARDSTVRLFDYMTGHELQSHNLSPSWACSVCFSDNGEYFATGSFDNNVIIFRTRDFARMREIRVFNLGIMCVRFPKDLSYVVVGTTEGFVQQINL
ncbi:hypothetical protein HK105_207178 [Polyrhizophydium stewartii]|uniref:Uncharacterized protein n=1 Tax=Polyrhizophydium stewartii TaxID=2732419 RepID=A0ABR4N1D1_9FUNG|nr:hypothetical protein HK105_004112 [Polyrhizophydium stewartii]